MIMSKEKFLKQIKNEMFLFHKDSKYNLQRMAEYYAILKNTKDELMQELLNECNTHNFILDYRYDREDSYCSYGVIDVDLTDDEVKDMDICEEYYICEPYSRLNYHYEIEMTWYEHGSTDEYIPRITINKIETNNYIEISSEDDEDSKNIFNDWYEELTELRHKEKQDRLKSIEDNISMLQKEKEKLLKEED